MTYRKSPYKTSAKREWSRFVRNNVRIIAASGIPKAIVESVDHFDGFLSHGHIEHHLDPSGCRIEALTRTQYDALVTLTESYFAAGYEWFTPAALQPADQAALARRFAR